MSNVFISYRRDDSAPWAGRICDRLSGALGGDRVFMDVEDIPAGADFTEKIDATVSRCGVLIAVIGPRWLEVLRARAGERDFVREEIAAALRRKTVVIPVLVGDAVMPAERDLPAELTPLARRQAVALRDSSFAQDSTELVRAVQSVTAGGKSRRWLLWGGIAVGVLGAAGVAAVKMTTREPPPVDGVWIARMQRPGRRPYRIRLQLGTAGTALNGRVDYPTGSSAIHDGTITGERLAFRTRHIPQFANEPATLQITGERRGAEIALTMIGDDGILTSGIARRQTRPGDGE